MFCSRKTLRQVLQTIILQQYFHRCFKTGLRTRICIATLLYRKALRVKSHLASEDRGKVLNLMTVDAERLQNNLIYLHVVWSGLFQIILTLTSLYFVVGNALWAGFGFMLLTIPLAARVNRRVRAAQQKLMPHKDARARP